MLQSDYVGDAEKAFRDAFDRLKKGPLLNFEWVAARIDPSLGPLPEGT
jgi:hypothetical protein